MNTTLKGYWPCTFCLCVSYFLSPIAFGLSFFIGRECVRDAHVAVERVIARENRLKLKDKDLELTLVYGWSTSWLELRTKQCKEDDQVEIVRQ